MPSSGCTSQGTLFSQAFGCPWPGGYLREPLSHPPPGQLSASVFPPPGESQPWVEGLRKPQLTQSEVELPIVSVPLQSPYSRSLTQLAAGTASQGLLPSEPGHRSGILSCLSSPHHRDTGSLPAACVSSSACRKKGPQGPLQGESDSHHYTCHISFQFMLSDVCLNHSNIRSSLC